VATKTELFRYRAERAGPKRAPHVAHPPRPTDGSARSESAHAERKAAYLLEDAAGRPSRKSSRGGSNRQRTDAKSQAQHRLAEVRPRPPAPPHGHH